MARSVEASAGYVKMAEEYLKTGEGIAKEYRDYLKPDKGTYKVVISEGRYG